MSAVERTDFLVVGSGIAGLATAIKASRHGEVTLLTKGHLMESNTFYAQGGIAAAVGPDDSPAEHLVDTLRAGHDLVREDAAAILVEEGPQRVMELIQLGARFDVGPDGSLLLGREGAHSRNRILHARGDATGEEIAEVLAARAKEIPAIRIREHHHVLDLVVDQGRCIGAAAVDASGELRLFLARAVVMATGGCGQVYRYTTNPPVATGDGFAVAHAHGVTLVDMEFVQFHPTALARADDPLVLISEAVRGEGARLVNDAGDPFMRREHPMADLAPRDVVARAIFREMQAGRKVFLDARPIGPRFADRFPTIYQACRERGIDPARDLIPIAPAAHFIMGGIQTDLLGRTSLPGLYAVGEVACTGVHGANRLASNSLLEGLVFADRIAGALKDEAPAAAAVPPGYQEQLAARRGLVQGRPYRDRTGEFPELVARLRQVMWDHVGIIRSAEGLRRALDALAEIERAAPRDAWTLHNMVQTGKLIARAALEREESRGGHYREDFPEERAAWKGRRVTL